MRLRRPGFMTHVERSAENRATIMPRTGRLRNQSACRNFRRPIGECDAASVIHRLAADVKRSHDRVAPTNPGRQQGPDLNVGLPATLAISRNLPARTPGIVKAPVASGDTRRHPKASEIRLTRGAPTAPSDPVVSPCRQHNPTGNRDWRSQREHQIHLIVAGHLDHLLPPQQSGRCGRGRRAARSRRHAWLRSSTNPVSEYRPTGTLIA